MLPFNSSAIRTFTPNDVSQVLTFVGRVNQESQGCVAHHPGDVGHYLSNQLRGRDATHHVSLYQEADSIRAMVLNYAPQQRLVAVVLHPSDQHTPFASHLWDWAETQIEHTMSSQGEQGNGIACAVMSCDIDLQPFLVARGYTQPAQISLQVTRRKLKAPLPQPALPSGFLIRSVQGTHEADAVGTVHASAFGSRWDPGEYQRVMETPGFDPDRELVVESPDGQLVAFLVYWLDPISGCGLFEPVGCHSAFQRWGLTRALLFVGLHKMQEQGMQEAMVLHDPADQNPAPAGLYASVGFTPFATISEYLKRLD